MLPKKVLKYLHTICIIPKKTRVVLLELLTFTASKMEQFSTVLFNGQFCGTRLPTTGPICALGVPSQHLGMLEANSVFPEDEHC